MDDNTQSIDLDATIESPSRPRSPVGSAPVPQLDGFQVLGKLGEGGMGTVWRAVQLSTKREVALKLIGAAAAFSGRSQRRFEREIELTARLDHPNIARVFAGGVQHGICFYAMELIDGLPLDHFVRQRNLARPQILELTEQICQAVQHAHQRGVIHRDLKPSNIIVDQTGHPHVLDFGLAKAFEEKDDQMLSTEGGVAGTPVYMSPEQAAGHLDQLDTRSDVYTLGVILFHLLSNQFPHDTSGSALEIMKRISETEPKRLKQIEPKVDTDLEAMLSKALAREPQRRYASAGGLAADIGRYLKGEPLEAQPPTATYYMMKKLRKYRIPVAMAATVVSLLLGMAVWSYVRVTKERNAALIARQEAETQRRRAVENETQARKLEHIAEVRRTDALVQEGNALGVAGRWMQARTQYNEAFTSYSELREATFSADVGLSKTYSRSPPALMTFKTEDAPVRAVVVSPNGATALSADDKGLIHAWDLKTGRNVRTLSGHQGRVWALSESSDGRLALSGGADKTVRLWNLQTNECTTLLGHTGEVHAVAFSPDGRTALSGGDDRTLRLWDVLNHREIRRFGKHLDQVSSVRFSPDGNQALSGDTHGEIRLWDLASGALVREMRLDANVNAVAFSHDGQQVLTGESDSNLKLWDLRTGAEVRTFSGHTSSIRSVAVFPDGKSAVSGSSDGTLRIWDLTSGREKGQFGHDADVFSVAVTPDGNEILSGSGDASLRVWSLQPTIENRSFRVDGDRAAAVSADNKMIVSGGEDGLLKVWDVATGRQIRSITAPKIQGIAMTPNDRVAVSGNSDASVIVWDLAAGVAVHTMKGHRARVNSVTVSHDGCRAVSGSEDGDAKLWDLKTGKELVDFSKDGFAVWSTAFFPDDIRVATGIISPLHTLNLWDAQTGKLLREIDAGTSAVTAIAIFADGVNVAVGHNTSSLPLQIWDLAGNRKVVDLVGHTNRICRDGIVVSSDGRYVLSGSEDRTLKLWDMHSYKEVQSLDHPAILRRIAVSPNFQIVVCVCRDGTIEIWDWSRPATYREMEAAVRQAQDRLQDKPDDPASLAVLGRWYAFRGVNDWAIEMLEKARAGGAEVSPLALGRCYWQVGRISDAKAEFEKELATAKEDDKFYLQMCIGALGRALDGNPTTRPTAFN